MLIKLLSHYYRSGLRGSHRTTELINKFHSLEDVDLQTVYGPVNVDLTIASGQAISIFEDTPEGTVIAREANGVAYDIGAHFGIYSVLMAKKCRVYAFEPNTNLFPHLQKTAACNKFEAFNIALSDFDGTSDFFVPEEATMGSLVNWTHDADMRGISRFAGNVNRSDCTVRTLDSFVEERGLPLPNFIKVDVEGAEIKVFRGGRKTIAESRPTIFFEVSKNLWPKMNTSAQEGFDFFKSMGYKLFKDQTELADLDLEWDNVLAVPK